MFIYLGNIRGHEGTLFCFSDCCNPEFNRSRLPETRAFLSVLLAIPRPLLSKKTSASSLLKIRTHESYYLTDAHIRSIACQAVAKAKIFERFASTFFAWIPTSATLMENNGFRAAMATVSAVEVLPTPGGPRFITLRDHLVISGMSWDHTIE